MNARRRLADNIRLKRVYDPPSPEDGRRILITRYWPRGVPRSAVDEYTTKVAPSRALLREFKHEGPGLGGLPAPLSPGNVHGTGSN